MNICVYGAASSTIDKKYIEVGEKLGENMAKRGHTLVFGAGGNGLMGASARGEKRGGGKVIGIVPKFFNVDGVLFDEIDELIEIETMRERKRLLRKHSDGFIVTVGGIGTMDEFFEVFTLRHLKLYEKPIVVLNSYGFYDKLIEMLEFFVKENALFESSMDLFYVTDDIDDALDYLEKNKIKDK